MPLIDKIEEISARMVSNVSKLRPRFMYEEIKHLISRNERLIIIKGFRGVGKTTLMLHLAGALNGIYFSVEHPLISNKGIYSIARECIDAGYNLLFIDEVHKFPEWKEHVKSIYEEFPDVQIVASGSAALLLSLGRREKPINLDFLTYREFLYLKGIKVPKANEWKEKRKALKYIPKLKNFEQYITYGGLPVSISQPDPLEKIFLAIKKSMVEDSLAFTSLTLKDVKAMEHILYAVATSKPGELSIHSLSRNLGITKYAAYNLIDLLEKMGILRLIRPYARGFKMVRVSPKLLFSHPSLRTSVCNALGIEPDIGALREELAVFSLLQRGYKVFTSRGERKNPDYIIEKGKERILIEVGGEGKGKAQLEGKKGIVITPTQLKVLALA